MAARNAPTGRHRRLATELRRMREQAGLSVQEAASLLGADRTMISNIEAGRTGISDERVRQLACHYGCPEPALVDALAGLTGPRRAGQWWDEYRGRLPDGHLEVSEVEHYATRIRTAQTVHLPGLLQTEEHARAIFELTVPKLSRLDVELRTAHRLRRQAILTGEHPTPYVGIIHEAALRLQFGGPDVARKQLTHLADSADHDNVTLLVIPFSAGAFHGAGQSVLYAEGALPQLDTVQLDTALGAHFVDAPIPLANYRSLLDLMERSALPPKESQELIRSIAREC
ncbi:MULTISPECIES: helix-turn-helix transcriptional regulator [Streptomyces]|uniref:Transcriptional regulator n=1 Tax=Streptomyces venezuelae TaxID=54571 RepID=A0A5P2BHN0_STRVZ|nr:MULTISPECIES: helix-turn-helix transcriptional regulator [Streptomyces]NEA02301.1 helix-turn-helix transcriptional regulator [Streptomyces sp. SID10116]MYY86567.1 helix-turn-helix domain-containing protein [Streptomyces sp. SID335]MYZ14278.1 helix-turn-helix domain-containing protein [Streptomyces sp. SID337]NDZ90370.1 helix-turn-helix transcriptional regulator [Streptomyces sp. SID10115]NEB48034.1 helix-turn-helix transcriptional regulator [Streptomyces sp. SID339]